MTHILCALPSYRPPPTAHRHHHRRRRRDIKRSMRLTAKLINNSLSYLNPLKERELDLRGTTEPAQMMP